MEEKEEKNEGGYDISDLDISALFVEPEPPVGMFTKFLPWVNLILMLVILVVVIFKIQ